MEERERDLELAARIGKSLLEKHRQLEDQVKGHLRLFNPGLFFVIYDS